MPLPRIAGPWSRLPKISAFIRTLLDDASASAALTTLGVSAFAQTVLDDASARAAMATLKGVHVLAQSFVAASHTGDTNETTLATVTVPAGAMGANGSVRVTTYWSRTNNGNTVTMFVRFNGTGGTAYLNSPTVSRATLADQLVIANRNATNSQVGRYVAGQPSYSSSTGAAVTSSIDTTAAVDISIRGQLGTGTDTITLEGYLVELIVP